MDSCLTGGILRARCYNTMKYTQLIGFKDDEFTVRVAHTEEEACQLLETSYEYIRDYNANKLFRKRK